MLLHPFSFHGRYTHFQRSNFGHVVSLLEELFVNFNNVFVKNNVRLSTNVGWRCCPYATKRQNKIIKLYFRISPPCGRNAHVKNSCVLLQFCRKLIKIFFSLQTRIGDQFLILIYHKFYRFANLYLRLNYKKSVLAST
jgi:hypothetical protein